MEGRRVLIDISFCFVARLIRNGDFLCINSDVFSDVTFWQVFRNFTNFSCNHCLRMPVTRYLESLKNTYQLKKTSPKMDIDGNEEKPG